MNKKLAKLIEEAKESGANEDYAHQELCNLAQEYVGELDLSEKELEEYEDKLIEAYIQGFCEAEGYGKGSE